MEEYCAYTVILLPEPEGGFAARVPALPEISVHGNDEAAALDKVKDAISAAIEQRAKSGETIPQPQSATVQDVMVLVREVTVLMPMARGTKAQPKRADDDARFAERTQTTEGDSKDGHNPE